VITSIQYGKVKIKVLSRTGHEDPERKLYSYFNLGAKWGWVVNAPPLTVLPPVKKAVPTV